MNSSPALLKLPLPDVPQPSSNSADMSWISLNKSANSCTSFVHWNLHKKIGYEPCPLGRFLSIAWITRSDYQRSNIKTENTWVRTWSREDRSLDISIPDCCLGWLVFCLGQWSSPPQPWPLYHTGTPRKRFSSASFPIYFSWLPWSSSSMNSSYRDCHNIKAFVC